MPLHNRYLSNKEKKGFHQILKTCKAAFGWELV